MVGQRRKQLSKRTANGPPRRVRRRAPTRNNIPMQLNMPSRTRRVTVPAAFGGMSTNISSSLKSIRVRHTEMLGPDSVTATGIPEVIATAQPGFFPWGKFLARNYEKYEIHSLRFRRESSAATSTAGATFLLFDTDCYDTIPDTVQDMMSSSLAVSGPNWGSISLQVPQEVLKSYVRRYTRISGVQGDLKTYDMGKLIIAKTSTTASTGNIFVDYDITFHVPQVAIDPSGHIDEGDPKKSGNDYGLDPSTALVTGRPPFSIAFPTAEQVVEGATAGLALLNMAPNSQGLLTLRGTGDSATMALTAASAGNTVTALTTEMINGATKSTTMYKWLCDSAPSWIQPYVTDAATAVSFLLVTAASGKYAFLDA